MLEQDSDLVHANHDFSDREIAEFGERRHKEAEKNYRIHHHYDIRNQDIYVEQREGAVDGQRAVLYCQFRCEEWFGYDAILSNLAVGALLCMFYGYRHRAVAVFESATAIDMYSDRETACGAPWSELLANTSLHRIGMREAMAMLVERC